MHRPDNIAYNHHGITVQSPHVLSTTMVLVLCLNPPNLIDRELGLGVVNHSSFVGRRKNSRFPLRAVPFVPTIVFAVFPSEYEKNCLRKTLKRHWWQAKEKRKKEKKGKKNRPFALSTMRLLRGKTFAFIAASHMMQCPNQ